MLSLMVKLPLLVTDPLHVFDIDRLDSKEGHDIKSSPPNIPRMKASRDLDS